MSLTLVWSSIGSNFINLEIFCTRRRIIYSCNEHVSVQVWNEPSDWFGGVVAAVAVLALGVSLFVWRSGYGMAWCSTGLLGRLSCCREVLSGSSTSVGLN